MGEYDALCEKVLRKLENILERDQEIREFAIVPTSENNTNKSPIVYESNCLGIESWCAPYIQRYCHSVLLKQRKKLSKNQLSNDDMRNLNHILNGALFVQPCVVTFWNMKRELAEYEMLDEDKELYFNELLLCQHPKSYEAFSYRRWILGLKIKYSREKFFWKEMEICEKSAAKSQNNYHSWNHRIWCMEMLKQIYPEMENTVFCEFTFSHSWLNYHVSEYTGYNYRQYLFNYFKNMRAVPRVYCDYQEFMNALKYLSLKISGRGPSYSLKFLFGLSRSLRHDEIDKYLFMITKLLDDLTLVSFEFNYLFRNHECLWNYRRFIIIQLIELIYDYHGMKMNNKLFIKPKNIVHESNINLLNLDISDFESPKPLPTIITKSRLFTLLIGKEIEYVNAYKHPVESTRFDMAQRYLKWLKLMNFVLD